MASAEVPDSIKDYDFLKLVNGNFSDLVGHYLSMWEAYHYVLTITAGSILGAIAIAWSGVRMLQAPEDKLRSCLAGIGGACVIYLLLSLNTFSFPGAAGNVKMANGAGWTLTIIGNVYTIFKKNLDAINSTQLNKEAFARAYHVTNQNTLKRFIDSPVYPMYADYLAKCEPAFIEANGDSAEAVEAGRYVGFFGSTGIGAPEIEFEDSRSFIEKIKGDKPEYASDPVHATLLDRDGASKVKAGTQRGMALLDKIPEDKNPFDGQTTPPDGYQVPSKTYWAKKLFPETDSGSEPTLLSAADSKYNHYLNKAFTEAPPSGGIQNFYPRNCKDMFLMIDTAQRNYHAAVSQYAPSFERTSLMRDGNDAAMIMLDDLQSAAAQKKSGRSTLATYGGKIYKGDEMSNDRLVDRTINSAYTELQDIGMRFKEWMLIYKIPMMINGCAMLAALMLIAFPLVCIIASMTSLKVLFTTVKIVAFCFIVVFINDLCLTMASTMLAVNNEALQGYNMGNYAENQSLLISAGSGQYVVFMGLTVVELIFAKILLWDDVKSLSGFNPGGAATGIAGTGLAIAGAALNLASKAFSAVGPGIVEGATSSMSNSAATSANVALQKVQASNSAATSNVMGFTPGSQSSAHGAPRMSIQMPTPSPRSRPSSPTPPTPPTGPKPGRSSLDDLI